MKSAITPGLLGQSQKPNHGAAPGFAFSIPCPRWMILFKPIRLDLKKEAMLYN
jgi:hypothetical protein